MLEVADQLEWLLWFWREADFGPAHGDVMVWMQRRFEKETGKRVPENYREGYLTEAEEYEKDEA